MVLICRGTSGAGMEETYQLTSALKYLPFGKDVVLLTDARFSGVSTGACIGHISPEALAGGPIGKLRDVDLIEVIIDQNSLEASVNFVGEAGVRVTPTEAARILASRPLRADLAADPALPPETRLWAMLQQISGGSWGGCLFHVEASFRAIAREALTHPKRTLPRYTRTLSCGRCGGKSGGEAGEDVFPMWKRFPGL